MQVDNINKLQFKGLYHASSNIEERIMWNKAMVSGAVDVGWLIKANNAAERREKARRFALVLSLGYLTPLITLPFSNRLAMKYFSKLTKSFWSDNHKAIHLSNKYLFSAEKTKEGLAKLSKDYSNSPFELLWSKITGKKTKKEPLDFQPLLDKCGGDYEKLRKKLINAKSGVLASDIIFTSITTGSVGFVNNLITKKQTGMSGFSAEMSMADKEIVEKRAKNYEKNWKKRFAFFLSTCALTACALPLMIRKGLKNPNTTEFAKKWAPKFDYNDGIYMSRMTMIFGGFLLTHFGTLLATRNKTELKDNIARYTITDAIFFGGDVLLGSLFANAADKLFKTNLTKPVQNKKGGLRNLLPNFKSLKEVANEVKEGKIAPKNKHFALGLWWLNMIALTTSIGLGVPELVNAVTRKDIKKDVEKARTTQSNETVYSNEKMKNSNLFKLINSSG